jgi:hypothetical protein
LIEEGFMFGLGKGSINISIQRVNYAPGDLISGNVSLTVKKPVRARETSISLISEQKVTRQVRSTSGPGMARETQTIRIYDFKQQLDGEKEYSQPGEYRSEIRIPADILGAKTPTPELTGGLATGLRIAQQLGAMTGAFPSQHTKWYLQAKLDIPGGFDVLKNADITIA